MIAFQSSPTKGLIRKVWDLAILKAYRKHIGHRLTYFGLPGPEIEDLRDWRTILSYKTCVERLRPSGKAREEDLKIYSRMLDNAFVYKLDVGFQLLRGDVEDILLRGMDLDGHFPKLREGETSEEMRLRYDLYHLDFLGGMGYKDKTGTSKRLRALKKLLDRQRGQDFLLLLTINVRDTMGDELTIYLEERSQKYGGDSRLKRLLRWYSQLGEGGKSLKLKAAVPLFIQEESEVLGAFKCYSYPPLCYVGTGKATMMHFAFNLFHESGRDTPVLSPQTPKQLIELPLMQADGITIKIASTQHPDFDKAKCRQHLQFLPASTRNAILRAS